MHPAACDPATTAALAAYRGGALRWLGGGLVAVVLAVIAGLASVAVFQDSGRRVPVVGLAVVVLLFVGPVAVVTGAGSLHRCRRWARALAVTPWQTGVLRTGGPAVLAFEPAGYDELDPEAEPVRLQLESTTIWRTRVVQRLDGAHVRAAPVGAGRWVLTADGLGTLYGARERRARR